MLSMQKHISSICCASFLELRRIASIRPYLSQSVAARLVAAVVISRLDYCNSALTGLPADQIARLQRVQNNAERLVLKKRRRDHVTPLYKELHWLPVNFAVSTRLQFLLTAILKGLYLLIFLHLSALMNRLSLSDLLMKSCSKFQSEISNHLDNVLSVSWHHLSGILCRPLKKCTNTISIQIAVKNLLVCPGLPVESEEICVYVWQLNVDGCIWIGRGGIGVGGENMRDLGKRRRHGLGGWWDRFKLVLFEIIKLMFC